MRSKMTFSSPIHDILSIMGNGICTTCDNERWLYYDVRNYRDFMDNFRGYSYSERRRCPTCVNWTLFSRNDPPWMNGGSNRGFWSTPYTHTTPATPATPAESPTIEDWLIVAGLVSIVIVTTVNIYKTANDKLSGWYK